MMCEVYTDVCGIKKLYHICTPVRKIIHSLKLVDYLHVQADNPWCNYYLTSQSANQDLNTCHFMAHSLNLHDSYITKFAFMNYAFADLVVAWL